jgi:hypothetical protein
MAKVLTIPVHKNAAVATHVLCVPAAKVGIEESVVDPTQRLYRCFKAVTADIELDTTFLCLNVIVHGLNFSGQLH